MAKFIVEIEPSQVIDYIENFYPDVDIDSLDEDMIDETLERMMHLNEDELTSFISECIGQTVTIVTE